MKIEVDEKKRPVKCKVRRYPPAQRRFLNKYVDKLVEMGFLQPNPDAKWVAAPHLVPKNSKAQFRTTIDIGPLNSATIGQSWSVPNIDTEILDLEGHGFYAIIDFVSGYWQIPLDPTSIDLCRIICPKGTYSSSRVLHGLKNAAPCFQYAVEPLFSALRNNLKAWLDDFMLHAKSEDELIDLLERFFEICAAHNLYISAKKFKLFDTQAKWFGRISDREGYRLDPSNAEGI